MTFQWDTKAKVAIIAGGGAGIGKLPIPIDSLGERCAPAGRGIRDVDNAQHVQHDYTSHGKWPFQEGHSRRSRSSRRKAQPAAMANLNGPSSD